MTKPAADSGIELIERDHQIFRSLVDRLQVALVRDLGEATVVGRKAELLAFLDGHIEFENRVMRDMNYPISFTHIEEHGAFRNQVTTVLDEAGKTVSGPNLAKLLKKIHDHHIKYFDAVLCHYLADKYALTIVDDGLGI